jgi:methionyl-tRNA formyltransferase
MRISFLGINSIGKRILDWLQERDEEIVCMLTEKRDLEKIHQLHPDLIISCGFRHIVPPEILSVPGLGAINIHKSFLPLNRGANPVFWTLLDGTRAGVSIHFMTEEVDAGSIIAQREVEVAFDDTAKSLYRKLEEIQFDLFIESWEKIKQRKTVPRSQEGTKSIHRIRDFQELRRIDPDRRIRIGDFLRYLKAMTFPPFQNAFLEMEGERYYVEIKIRKESPAENLTDETGHLKQYK